MRTGHVDHETGLWVDDGPPDDLGEAPGVDNMRTQLAPHEETAFQSWKGALPPRLQSDADYDLRGFYKKNPTWSLDTPDAHMTDEFKLPNHPTFSNESRYYNDQTAHLGGHWMGDVYVPNDGRFKRLQDETPGADPNDPPPAFLVKSQDGSIAARARAIKATRAAGPAPFALTDYAQPQDTAGPVTDQTMADTRAAKIREIQDSAGMIGDQDKSRQTYENVNRGLARPENRDLTMDDIVTLETQQADRAEQLKPARDFALFAAAGGAGELAAPLVGRGVSALADKARAIRAARAAAAGPRPISDPAALRPVERGPEPEFWSPRDSDHGADLFETPSTMERTANIRLPQHRSP